MNVRRALVSFVVALPLLVCNAQLNTARVMEIGRNALYFEDYVLSIQYFNKVIDAKPFLHEPYFFRGLAKYNLDDFVGAWKDLSVAIEKNPYVARCYQLRGLCLAQMDSVDAAERDFVTAIKYDPQNSNVWQNRAAVAMNAGEWERAAVVIDSLLTFSPRNSEAYMMRARVAIDMGDTVLAESMSELAVKYDSFSPEVYEMRAMIKSARGGYEQAEADLDKVVELMPARSSGYINRALVRYHRNNLRGAMEDYDMALYVEPGSFYAHYNRGLLRMMLGDDDLALEDFGKVLEIDPDNTMARFNRALLRNNTGDYKGAIDDYDRVIADYPNFEYAYRCRAESKRKYGDTKGADADERWLLKRQLDIYNNGVTQTEEYSADKDKTRKRSDENVRNYNKMVVADDKYSGKFTTEYRGKVQNRNVFVELEPMFVLTYYKKNEELETAPHFYKPVEELNRLAMAKQPLLLTNAERALAEKEVERHFAYIDIRSKSIADEPDVMLHRVMRAIDSYLVKDMEAAMSDLNAVKTIGEKDWFLYFVRSYVRFRMLETMHMNEVNDADGYNTMHENALPDLDYRLVKADLDRVVELMPDFAYAYYNRANVLAKLNDFKSAIVDYSKAIELNDRFAEAYFNRGLAKIYTGNSEGGVSDLSKAGELGMFQAYNIIKRFMNRR